MGNVPLRAVNRLRGQFSPKSATPLEKLHCPQSYTENSVRSFHLYVVQRNTAALFTPTVAAEGLVQCLKYTIHLAQAFNKTLAELNYLSLSYRTFRYLGFWVLSYRSMPMQTNGRMTAECIFARILWRGAS